MNQQCKKFFVKHGDNEFTYYGSHMSMHMGSGSMLVYNDQGDVVGAHKQWDCAYEISLAASHMEKAKSNGITACIDNYRQMQKERNCFANTMLDSIVNGDSDETKKD